MGREPIGVDTQSRALGPTANQWGSLFMSLFHAARSRGVVVLAAAAVLAVGAGSGAVAGAMITGKDIKDHSIKAKDLDAGSVTTNKVKNKTLKLKDLSSEVTAKLGIQGPAGPRAPLARPEPRARMAPGPRVPTALRRYAGPNWSIIDRNVNGGGDAYLRSGPTANWTGTLVKPPMGIGSLGLRTGSNTDKAAFGNEVDFQGKALASISSVSFWEYTTGENRATTSRRRRPATWPASRSRSRPTEAATAPSTTWRSRFRLAPGPRSLLTRSSGT